VHGGPTSLRVASRLRQRRASRPRGSCRRRAAMHMRPLVQRSPRSTTPRTLRGKRSGTPRTQRGQHPRRAIATQGPWSDEISAA
jgi:hypothetical protein